MGDQVRPPHSRVLHDVPVGMLHGVGVLALKPDPLSSFRLCRARFHQPMFFHYMIYGAPAYVLVCQCLGDAPHSRAAAPALIQHQPDLLVGYRLGGRSSSPADRWQRAGTIVMLQSNFQKRYSSKILQISWPLTRGANSLSWLIIRTKKDLNVKQDTSE